MVNADGCRSQEPPPTPPRRHCCGARGDRAGPAGQRGPPGAGAGHPPAPGRPARHRALRQLGREAVRPDNLAFSPQYPLWTDGATKRRWVHIPRGKWVDASRPDDWVFPPGTRFWKEFGFGRPVETRYIERRRDGTWLYATYVWSEDGSDARLAPEFGVAVSHEIRPGVHHSIPGVTDCRACHEGKTSPVLGFDALQLSPDRDPLAPHGAALASGRERSARAGGTGAGARTAGPRCWPSRPGSPPRPRPRARRSATCTPTAAAATTIRARSAPWA